ncbi:MAG: hypothetical protein HY535_09100 [Chloroflexi bacterium]|nr:hypothetical protein [Chloroflexota bacterium]
MDLAFDQGSQEEPRGHAILYFRSGADVLATYLVVLPMKVDFAKYVPPVLAAHVKDVGLEEFSAFAIPPAPEAVPGGMASLEALAQRRQDDLVSAGELPTGGFLEAAQRVHDAVLAYARVYAQRAEAPGERPSPAAEPVLSDLGVEEVLYSFMSERDKLGELAKLVGKLQFAVEGNDRHLVRETVGQMRSLARYLPDSYRIPQLVEAVERSPGLGLRLAQLYLDRCYKLSDQDYPGVRQVEEAIRQAESANG